MHLLRSIAIQPNLELKTQPKELLGSLLLDVVLPGIDKIDISYDLKSYARFYSCSLQP
jgi:hypothetical protein